MVLSSVQKFAPTGGAVKFVNLRYLYIDDGEECKNIAMGKSRNLEIIKLINKFLFTFNPFIQYFRRIKSEPSVNAHLDFKVTKRSKHGSILGDRR